MAVAAWASLREKMYVYPKIVTCICNKNMATGIKNHR